jgi:acyl-CoA synthetase (AMP-forming)/AMP-acid ligase II
MQKIESGEKLTETNFKRPRQIVEQYLSISAIFDLPEIQERIKALDKELNGTSAKDLKGKPIANTTAYVFDPSGQPVPVNVPGELYLGGAGLAIGYLNQPKLTAEKFVPHPVQLGERLYRCLCTRARAALLALSGCSHFDMNSDYTFLFCRGCDICGLCIAAYGELSFLSCLTTIPPELLVTVWRLEVEWQLPQKSTRKRIVSSYFWVTENVKKDRFGKRLFRLRNTSWIIW